VAFRFLPICIATRGKKPHCPLHLAAMRGGGEKSLRLPFRRGGQGKGGEETIHLIHVKERDTTGRGEKEKGNHRSYDHCLAAEEKEKEGCSSTLTSGSPFEKGGGKRDQISHSPRATVAKKKKKKEGGKKE